MSGTNQGAKKTDQVAKVAPPADKADTTSAFRLTEEEKKPRQIALRPPVVESTPAEGEKQSTGETQQGAKSEKEKEQTGKPEGKSNTFGFFTSKKPVDIVSDTMEGLEKGKVIIFKGNVVTKQDDLRIFSDTLTAHLNEESNEVERAEAEGNVKIRQSGADCNLRPGHL